VLRVECRGHGKRILIMQMTSAVRIAYSTSQIVVMFRSQPYIEYNNNDHGPIQSNVQTRIFPIKLLYSVCYLSLNVWLYANNYTSTYTKI
jgi:hypothetical protein